VRRFAEQNYMSVADALEQVVDRCISIPVIGSPHSAMNLAITAGT
jgi:hypothetical protein